MGVQSTGQRFTCRRRISSVGNSGRHGSIENDCRVTCYNCDDARPTTSRRRHSSAVRPVHLFCRQHPAGNQHPAGHHPAGPGRTRTFSVLSAGPSDAVEAATDARHRARRDLHDSQSPTDYIRVRSFSTSSRGVKNRGDSFKRRQHHTSSSSSFDENNIIINGNSSSTTSNDVSELKVVVVGDVGVGKRSIVSQFTTSEYMHGTTDSPSAQG